MIRALVIGLSLALVGCQAPSGAGGGSPAGGYVPIAGVSSTGEACQLEQRLNVSNRRADRIPLDLVCAGATRPVGGLTRSTLPLTMPTDAAGRRTAIEGTARQGGWAQALSRKLSCQPGEWRRVGAIELLIAACTQKTGGWPHATLIGAAGESLFQAEGPPAVLDLLVAAMTELMRDGPSATVSGPQPPRGASRLPELEAILGKEAFGFGAVDLDGFQDLIELARLYNSAENYQGAEQAYRRALDAQIRLLGEQHSGVGVTLMHLALEVSNQGRDAEADALFRRAEPLLRTSVNSGDYPRYVAYLALAAANKRSYRDAERLARQATALRREINDRVGGIGEARSVLNEIGANRAEVAHSLWIEASMALRLGERDRAERQAAEARRLLETAPGSPPWWMVQIASLQSDIAAADQNWPVAVERMQTAADLRRTIFGSGLAVANGEIALARQLNAASLHEDALVSYRLAVDRLAEDRAVNPTLDAERLIPLLDAIDRVSTAAPARAAALADEALRAVQLIRGGLTGQTITRMAARQAIDNPAIGAVVRGLDQAVRRRDLLLMELGQETAKLRGRDPGRERQLADQVEEENRKVRAATVTLGESAPEQARLAAPRPLPAAELRAALLPEEALLIPVIGRSGGFLLVARSGETSLHRLALDEAGLGEMVSKLRRSIAPERATPPQFDAATASELYQALLKPAEAVLAPVKHLAVVAVGGLASLPLNLLLTEPARSETYSTMAWVARRWAVTTLPSVRALADLRRLSQRPHAPEAMIAYANPVFEGPQRGQRPTTSAAGCRDGAGMAPAALRALDPLPDTETEVRIIASRLGAESSVLRLGAAANEPGLRGEALDRFRVVYFATHGLLPGELRCANEPALALSPPSGDRATAATDGLLEASEIATLRLNADLVVLSACNTAVEGQRFGGEALASLSESFFQAGARSLLVTHWKIPSAETVRLTTALFDGLKADPTIDAASALSIAQEALIADPQTGHPVYWAAFSLVGDRRASANLAGAARQQASLP